MKRFLATEFGKILRKTAFRFYTILKLLLPVWLLALVFNIQIEMSGKGLLLLSLLILSTRLVFATLVYLYYALNIGTIEIPEMFKMFVEDVDPIIDEVIKERVRNSI